MKPLVYERAGDLDDAARRVADDPEAVFLAGGTNLVDLMKLEVTSPGVLVDINRLGLDTLAHHDDGSVQVGATLPNSELAGDPTVREHFPVLAQAILAGASGQLRSAATTAGNLLQRSRCVYFQDVTKPCNKRVPGSGCPARTGAHRDLAVLGTSEHCVAHHQSDMAVALAALDAVVHIRGADGELRSIPVTEFHLLPGTTPHIETVLERGDLITAVELPAVPAGAAQTYRKVRDRWSYAFALVSVAAVVRTAGDGTLDHVRVALGGMAPRPWRAHAVESALLGRHPTLELLTEAARTEVDAARPLPHNAFKVDLAVDLITTVLRDLIGIQEQQ